MNKIEFTKRCLSDALFQLMKEKSFEEISIQEIVDKAGFSRMAYYRNFSSIRDIIDYFLEVNILSSFKEANVDIASGRLATFFNIFFQTVTTDRCREISEVFRKQQLLTLVYSVFYRAFVYHAPEEKKYYCAYVAGGIFGTYIQWILSGYKETVEELKEALNKQFMIQYQQWSDEAYKK